MIEYISCKVISSLPQTLLHDLVTPPTNNNDTPTTFSDHASVSPIVIIHPETDNRARAHCVL